MDIYLYGFKNNIENHIKAYLSRVIDGIDYTYTTFGKDIENLIADSLDDFFSRNHEMTAKDFKRAKDKNDFPDYTLKNKYAIEFKCAINTEDPKNDLGTINSWPKKIKKFGGDNIYFVFVKYEITNNSASILAVYFDHFYRFIGKSRLNTLKYREKDGNLRPKSWEDFSKQIIFWNSYNDFSQSFNKTKSVRAKKLVEKHYKDMNINDLKNLIKKVKKWVKDNE